MFDLFKVNKKVMNSGSTRIEYIDALRGFLILLVVYQHLHYFSYGRDLAVTPGKFNDIVVIFSLPLFFLLSGFVSYKYVTDYNLKKFWKFAKTKSSALLIPTFLCLSIFLFVYDLPLVSALTDKMKSGYWFTYTLFEYLIFYHLILLVGNKLKLDSVRSDLFLLFTMFVFCGLTALEFLGFRNDITGISGIGNFWYYLFFVVGVMMRKHYRLIQKLMDNSLFMGIIIVIFFISVFFCTRELRNLSVEYILPYILLAITGPLAIFAFFRRYQNAFSSDKPLGISLQYIGKHTMEIYLLHYFFLPVNLDCIGAYFAVNPSSVLELILSIFIASMISIVCLIIASLIRVSDALGRMLLGQKA